MVSGSVEVGLSAGRTFRYRANGTLTTARGGRAIPVAGILTIAVGPGPADGESTIDGDWVLEPSVTTFEVLGRRLAGSASQMTPLEPFTGRVAPDGTVTMRVSVMATILSVRLLGIRLLGGSRCRTAQGAVLAFTGSEGFDLERGGTLTARYTRPPFEGCGILTPLVNRLLAGPGNDAVVALTPIGR